MNLRSTQTHPAIHVVHIIGSLQTGGAEMALVNYLRAADKDEFRHTVLCLNRRGELAGEVEATGVAVEVVRVRFRRLWRDLGILAGRLRDLDAVVVHSHLYFAALWAQAAGMRAGVPVLVTTEHGKELWKKPYHVVLARWLNRKAFRHIAVSEDVRAIRTQRQGFAAERMVLVPNGVPIPPRYRDPEARARARQEFGLDPAQPVFGTVGRVVVAKGYSHLLEALAMVRHEIPDIHWLQIGDGPGREALVAQAASLGLEDAVTFAGRRTDVGYLLHALDLWVMSSVREGLPVSLLETMAAGCPIVATDVGGIPDAVAHECSALLVPPADPGAMAEGIIRLLADPERAKRLGEAARERAVATYSDRAVARRIEEIYRQGVDATRLRG